MHTHTHTHTHIDESLERPVFGVDLDEHLSHSKRDIAMVLEVCCTALRKNGMDTEGLFRIGAGSAKVKFLKVNVFLQNYYSTGLERRQRTDSTGNPSWRAALTPNYQ